MLFLIRSLLLFVVLSFLSSCFDENPPGAIVAPNEQVPAEIVSEVGETLCLDGIDNDQDGLGDCQDTECVTAAVCQQAVIPPATTAAYPFGILPTTASSALADAIYDAFMADYYEVNPEGTMARIRWDTPEYTVSEGIGYGMLAALYAYGTGDPDRFGKLFAYYKNNVNAWKLMGWKIVGFTPQGWPDIGSEGAATDADLDVALALILASQRWGIPEYLAEAQIIMTAIRNNLLSVSADGNLLQPGSKMDEPYNPSYISLVALRYFQLFDMEIQSPQSWDNILNNNLALLQKSQNPITGLFPDWVDKNGVPTAPPYNMDANYNKFYLEAIRVPWRMIWDYLWFGDERVKNSMILFSTWANASHGGNALNIGENYLLDGSLKAGGDGLVVNVGKPGYVGAFACGAMVDLAFQSWLDNSYNVFVNQSIDPASIIPSVKQLGGYYHRILQVMEVQLLSGMWTKP